MKKKRIPWAVAEDEICCKMCVDLYVVRKEVIDIEKCVERIKDYSEMQERDKSSVRMRIQNIKALLEDLGIENTLDIRLLNNAAKQTRDVLEECLKNAGIKTEN